MYSFIKAVNNALRSELNEDYIANVLTLDGYLKWCAGQEVKLEDIRPEALGLLSDIEANAVSV